MTRIAKATFSGFLSFFAGLSAIIFVLAAIYISTMLSFSYFIIFGILALTALTGVVLRISSCAGTLKDQFSIALLAVPFVIMTSTLLGFNDLIYLY